MKTKQVKLLLVMLAAVLFAWSLNSCSKSSDAAPTVSKTVLNDSITAATALISSTVEGTEDGQYATGSQVTLAIAIGQAEAIANSSTVTQTQVNGTVSALAAAIATYRAGKIVPVAASNLVGHWGFDEGTGSTAGDASGNNFNGAFKAGPSQWGSVMPTWTTDRKGNSKKAIQFNNGASVEVPYNTKFNPQTLTLAAWVKVDTVNANNRFIGLWSWNGYKFQLQDGNRPFATFSTSASIYDRDAAVGLPDDKQWHHLAVTYVDGTETFYIDGVNVKVWTDVSGTCTSISSTPYNLVIGADFPVDKYNPDPNGTDYNTVGSQWYHVIPIGLGRSLYWGVG
ncbi:MAG: LamG domain-containing protein [Cyclobacteriaceae bacterium]